MILANSKDTTIKWCRNQKKLKFPKEDKQPSLSCRSMCENLELVASYWIVDDIMRIYWTVAFFMDRMYH